jgi:hypothetical protein
VSTVVGEYGGSGAGCATSSWSVDISIVHKERIPELSSFAVVILRCRAGPAPVDLASPSANFAAGAFTVPLDPCSVTHLLASGARIAVVAVPATVGTAGVVAIVAVPATMGGAVVAVPAMVGVAGVVAVVAVLATMGVAGVVAVVAAPATMGVAGVVT